VLGCHGPQDSPLSPDFGFPRCIQVALCVGTTCGVNNSPIINTFPINGLSADGNGACNAAAIQLLPRSLAGGGCGSGADLTIDTTNKAETKLVGIRNGKQVCSGQQLTGAAFVVRSAAATLSLTIANVMSIVKEGTRYEGYRVESGGRSTCDADVAKHVIQELGFELGASSDPGKPQRASKPPVPVTFTPSIEDDLVIPLAGTLVSQGDHVVPDEAPRRFFNLACAGDALAKVTFLHLDGSPAQSETALKMLTANYCGTPLTVRGMAIEFTSTAAAAQVTLGEREARWAAGKAVCIDTPRLMRLSVEPGVRLSPTKLPLELQPAGCETNDPDTPGKCEETEWTAKLRTSCNVDACSHATVVTADFASFLDPTSGKLSIAKPTKP
jgi:hypothetical protein